VVVGQTKVLTYTQIDIRVSGSYLVHIPR